MSKNLNVFDIDAENEKAAKRRERVRSREIDDIKAVLKRPEGRRLALRILSQTGLFHASFSLNSMQTSFNEGKRDIGLWLLADIDLADPMAYSQMLREHYSELKSRQKKQEEKDGRATDND